MYRIELSPGEETVFRSIEELAVAIKRGVVTPRARIWHNASSKWLPIQFHPHYKTAVSMELSQAALVVGPPVKPLSSLSLQQPADPDPAPEPVAPPPRPFVGLVATPSEQPSRKKKKMRPEPPKSEKRSRRTTKSHRQLRIALIGALLVGGAQWVLSGPLFSRADAPALLHVQRKFVVTAPANTAAMVPTIRKPEAATTPASFGGVGVLVQGDPGQPEPRRGGSQSVAPVETAAGPEIEPAPSAIDVAAPAIPKPDSLAPKIVDSTRTKAMKSILRAVSTPSAKEKTPARR
jgi:hypothetical protein